MLVRTIDGTVAYRLPGLAAEIAFWVLLSLPAMVVTVIAATSLLGDLGGPDWQTQLVDRAAEVSRVALTEPTVDGVVVPLIERLLEGGGVGLVSFGFLAALWTASRAVKVVLTTVAIVYERQDLRRGWQDRLIGFGTTIGALLVGTVLTPLLLAGPNFGQVLEGWLGADFVVLADVWRAVYWPTVVVAATLALAAMYHLAVPGRSRWRRDLPGAVLATAVWLAGSGSLRLYGVWLTGGQSAYGPLAGPIVVLLWLWLTGFAVLLGGQLNAQIERRWPTMPSPATASSDDQPEDAEAMDPIGRPDPGTAATGALTRPQDRSPEGRS